MAKVVIAIANGFEEIEAVSIIDVLRRAQIAVTIAAVETKQLIGTHNIKIEADCMINEIDSKDFDMVILPGGLPNAFTLADSHEVQKLVKELKNADKYVTAICAAPYALHKADVLNENFTCYPSFEQKIRTNGYHENKNVVLDGKVITSRGPATAMEFALELVKVLKGEESFTNLKNELLANF